MGRRGLTKGAGLAVLAALAVYALLGGDLGQDDSGSTTATERAPVTSTVAEDPAPENENPGEPQAPPGFSEEETAGIEQTLIDIETGDLPFDQDGDTFQNREGHLPDREPGYYREYTVITPGSDDRGARRLVIGEGGDHWYTRDHYDSFTQIDPEDFRVGPGREAEELTRP